MFHPPLRANWRPRSSQGERVPSRLSRRRKCPKALGCLSRRVRLELTRLIGHSTRRLLHRHVTVTLLIGEGALRRIDRELCKLGEPRRESCESRYENRRAADRSRSMPGTRCEEQKATCSVSANKLLRQRSSTLRQITFNGTNSSGISFVESKWSKGTWPHPLPKTAARRTPIQGSFPPGWLRTCRAGDRRGRRRRS